MKKETPKRAPDNKGNPENGVQQPSRQTPICCPHSWPRSRSSNREPAHGAPHAGSLGNEREREQQWQQMQDAGLEEQADGAGEGWGEVHPYCMPLDGMRPCGNAHAYVSLPLVVLHGLQDCV